MVRPRFCLALLVLAVAALVNQGCANGQRSAKPVARGPAPAYSEVAERFNQRVGPLEKLWARTTVGVWYRDKEGQDRHDQFEGHFQYIRPDLVVMTFDKVGEVFAVLGSDPERFWWVQKQPEARAWVGSHGAVTPEKLAEIGLPVHPLSLLDLLAVTPLPSGGTVAWSSDGRLLGVTAPGRMGPRRVWLDPDTCEARRVELLGRGGEVALAADLSKYQPVALKAPRSAWSPTVASTLEGSRASDGLKIRMTLFDPETGGSRPQAKNLEFDRWREALGVKNVERLDAGGPAAAR